MINIKNLTDEAYQEHIILFQESEITLDIRFLPVVEQWYMDIRYKDFQIFGVKCAINTLHIEAQNMPFDFIITDESGAGRDPYRKTDWILATRQDRNPRCLLYMLNSDEMEEIRGASVPI